MFKSCDCVTSQKKAELWLNAFILVSQPHQRNIAHPFVSNGNEIRQILPPVMTVANQTTIRDDFSIVLSVFLRKYPQKRKETLPYHYKKWAIVIRGYLRNPGLLSI